MNRFGHGKDDPDVEEQTCIASLVAVDVAVEDHVNAILVKQSLHVPLVLDPLAVVALVA